MWGGKRALPEMKCVLERCNSTEKVEFWDDANQLQKFVWPIMRTDVMHHDSFCCGKFNETTILSRPFPTERKGGEHIGSVYLPVAESFETRDRDASQVMNIQMSSRCLEQNRQVLASA